MPLPQEAMSKEDFEAIGRGERPKKPKVIERPDPEIPKIDDLIKIGDIPMDRFKSLDKAHGETLKNKDGVRFIGYRVLITSEAKDKRQADIKIEGWMIEGDFHQLVREKSKEIDRKVIHW